MVLINSMYEILFYLLKIIITPTQIKILLGTLLLLAPSMESQSNFTEIITHLFHHSNNETRMRNPPIHVHPYITSGNYRKYSFFMNRIKEKTILYTDPKHEVFLLVLTS